jgi:hypothetical protein
VQVSVNNCKQADGKFSTRKFLTHQAKSNLFSSPFPTARPFPVEIKRRGTDPDRLTALTFSADMKCGVNKKTS